MNGSYMDGVVAGAGISLMIEEASRNSLGNALAVGAVMISYETIKLCRSLGAYFAEGRAIRNAHINNNTFEVMERLFK